MKKAALLVMAAALALAAGAEAAAGQRTPLLQEGKKTLFERVITRPDCRLVSRPGESADQRVKFHFLASLSIELQGFRDVLHKPGPFCSKGLGKALYCDCVFVYCKFRDSCS